MSEVNQPWQDFTSVERVVLLHDLALTEHPGARGPDNPGPCIDGALGAAFSAELYLEGKPHLKPGLSFAAHALVYLQRRHCFVDGNKRVGWLTALDILDSMGLSINASDDEVVDMIEAVISGEIESGEQVAAWMAVRLYAPS